ncbi:UNKNOWN [Stylonychia lemnae]|uniref:Uncharacterized protein n=1 Tax=Stylonychia lemnae TaxID=5949 RepID=A0A078ASQ1_STYLE|nr:UNKNOWN [Stylonychia lemnae]|eukprot:CDW85031.1 UNKNOWN [Stylonychia lemnae]
MQNSQQQSNRYNFRGLVTPPQHDSIIAISVDKTSIRDNAGDAQSSIIQNLNPEIDCNNRSFEQPPQEININLNFVEVKDYQNQQNDHKSQVFTDKTSQYYSSRNASYDKEKFESLKTQLENQKARFESQRQKMTEMQYASARANYNLLNKTFDSALREKQTEIKILNNILTQPQPRSQTKSIMNQNSDKQQLNQSMNNLSLKIQKIDERVTQQTQLIDTQRNQLIQQQPRILKVTQQSVISTEQKHKALIQNYISKQDTKIEDIQQTNINDSHSKSFEKSSSQSFSKTINEKIKNLKQDISQLFPNNQEPQNEHSRGRELLNKFFPVAEMNYSKSAERLQPRVIKLNQLNNDNNFEMPQTPVNANSFLKQTPSFLVNKQSREEIIKADINMFDIDMCQSKTILHTTCSEQQLTQQFQIHKNQDNPSEVAFLKQEVARLDQLLRAEREKMNEYKERYYRRRDHEKEKNKQDIQVLKDELSRIEQKYSNEVKKVQDQYDSYKVTKNERVKTKLKEQEERYLTAIAKEQLKNEELQKKILELQNLVNANEVQIERLMQFQQKENKSIKLQLQQKSQAIVTECEKCKIHIMNNAKLLSKIQKVKSTPKINQVDSKTTDKKHNQAQSAVVDVVEVLQEKIQNSQELDKRSQFLKKISKTRLKKLSKCVVDFSVNQLCEQQSLRIKRNQMQPEYSNQRLNRTSVTGTAREFERLRITNENIPTPISPLR